MDFPCDELHPPHPIFPFTAEPRAPFGRNFCMARLLSVRTKSIKPMSLLACHFYTRMILKIIFFVHFSSFVCGINRSDKKCSSLKICKNVKRVEKQGRLARPVNWLLGIDFIDHLPKDIKGMSCQFNAEPVNPHES